MLVRVVSVSAVLACSFALPSANAGVGNSIPSESLGNAKGLNYRSVSYSPFTNGGIDLFAQCQESAAVVGGGVHVTGPAAESQLAYGYPGDDGGADVDSRPDDFWVGAADNLGTDVRTITTYGICRTSGLDKVKYASRTVKAVPVGGSFSAKVKCPAGSAVVSGGSDVYRGRIPVSVPFDSTDGDDRPDDGWRVRARNDEPNAFDLTVHAVCLAGALPDLTYRSQSGEAKAGKAKTLSSTCPGNDAVIGGGVAIAGATATHFIHSSRPRDSGADPNSTPDDRWVATAVNEGGKASKATVHAICLT